MKRSSSSWQRCCCANTAPHLPRSWCARFTRFTARPSSHSESRSLPPLEGYFIAHILLSALCVGSLRTFNAWLLSLDSVHDPCHSRPGAASRPGPGGSTSPAPSRTRVDRIATNRGLGGGPRDSAIRPKCAPQRLRPKGAPRRFACSGDSDTTATPNQKLCWPQWLHYAKLQAQLADIRPMLLILPWSGRARMTGWPGPTACPASHAGPASLPCLPGCSASAGLPRCFA